MEIDIREVKKIFERIIDKLENEIEGDSIKIKTDFYRIIPTENWDDFSKNETDTHSLIDDVLELKKLINDSERPCTFVDFDRISSVLREVSKNENSV